MILRKVFLKTGCGGRISMVRMHGCLTRKELQKRWFEGESVPSVKSTGGETSTQLKGLHKRGGTLGLGE